MTMLTFEEAWIAFLAIIYTVLYMGFWTLIVAELQLWLGRPIANVIIDVIISRKLSVWHVLSSIHNHWVTVVSMLRNALDDAEFTGMSRIIAGFGCLTVGAMKTLIPSIARDWELISQARALRKELDELETEGNV